MDTLPVKPLVLRLLHQTREEELAFAATLSEEERAAPGGPESWSATYTLAHLTAAKRRLTQALIAMRRGETPSLQHDEAQVYAENQGRTWVDVEADAEATFAAFIAEVERLTDAELDDGNHHAWLEGRPLAAQILGYGVWHPNGHLTEYYRKRGDEERAARLQQLQIDAVEPVEDIPVVHSDPVSLYNMACLQATAGRHKKALQLLEEALRLDPELRENAKSDPDLAPLRGNSAFQATTAAM